MVSLLILKPIRNPSEEIVAEQWSENSYYQYFSGYESFGAGPACEASELVPFRKPTGERGVELILKESIHVIGDDSNCGDASIDTTVQEKNITLPTDAKLHRKIVKKCRQIAEKEELPVRQSYMQTLKKLGERMMSIWKQILFGSFEKVLSVPAKKFSQIPDSPFWLKRVFRGFPNIIKSAKKTFS